MQYKKKVINDRIIEAGKEEYLEKGYRGGNISTIAASAGVPVGNLYRYFDGKSGLLDAIVKPAKEALPKIINELSGLDENGEMSLGELMALLADKLVTIFEDFGKEIIILVDKCATTRYEDFGDDVTKQVAMIVLYKLYPEPEETDRVMAQLIAKAFINSIFDVLRHALYDKTPREPQAMKSVILRVLKFYFFNAEERK